MLTPAARELLGDVGYDPTYGARPQRWVIQKQLIARLEPALLVGETQSGDAMRVDVGDGERTLETVVETGPPPD
jgi:ATP-dependent Clp protease ATP-binding subunit ClpB